MIDYEKLKLANELAEKLTNGMAEGHILEIKTWFYNGNSYYELNDITDTISFDNKMNDIDDIIAKLQELTKPKSKYEVGQKVFVINYDGKPSECLIADID